MEWANLIIKKKEKKKEGKQKPKKVDIVLEET